MRTTPNARAAKQRAETQELEAGAAAVRGARLRKTALA
jgi:hypothetical protein